MPWNGSDTILVEVLIPFNYSNGKFIEGNPYGILYNEQLLKESSPMPMDQECIYSYGCKNLTNNGIPGAILFLNASNNVTLHIGGYPQLPGGYIDAPINIADFGNQPGILFLPKKSLGMLFTKLYLLNETVPGFKLVFTDNMPVNSFLSIENQVLPNINIYKINYTYLSKYELTGECSVDPSAQNYCDNLSYLPSIYNNYSKLIENTPIPAYINTSINSSILNNSAV